MGFQSAIEGVVNKTIGGTVAKNTNPKYTQNQVDKIVAQSQEKYTDAMIRMNNQLYAYNRRIQEMDRFITSKQRKRIEKNLGGNNNG